MPMTSPHLGKRVHAPLPEPAKGTPHCSLGLEAAGIQTPPAHCYGGLPAAAQLTSSTESKRFPVRPTDPHCSEAPIPPPVDAHAGHLSQVSPWEMEAVQSLGNMCPPDGGNTNTDQGPEGLP